MTAEYFNFRTSLKKYCNCISIVSGQTIRGITWALNKIQKSKALGILGTR